MVRIRLRRQGATHQGTFRIIVADGRSPRDGRFIENVGYFNARTEPPELSVEVERAQYWLSKGAQPSEAVRRLLEKAGALSQEAAEPAATAAQ
jgi:small subunit ribosomal protein S16